MGELVGKPGVFHNGFDLGDIQHNISVMLITRQDTDSVAARAAIPVPTAVSLLEGKEITFPSLKSRSAKWHPLFPDQRFSEATRAGLQAKGFFLFDIDLGSIADIQKAYAMQLANYEAYYDANVEYPRRTEAAVDPNLRSFYNRTLVDQPLRVQEAAVKRRGILLSQELEIEAGEIVSLVPLITEQYMALAKMQEAGLPLPINPQHEFWLRTMTHASTGEVMATRLKTGNELVFGQSPKHSGTRVDSKDTHTTVMPFYMPARAIRE